MPKTRRAELLKLAVLGLPHESPMHGYELRKRLNTVLGAFRAPSYGSLYPCLRDLLSRGWLFETDDGAQGGTSKRARIVYELTAEGKERFQAMAESASPAACARDRLEIAVSADAQRPTRYQISDHVSCQMSRRPETVPRPRRIR